jgi:hypothetical protein
MGIEENFSNPFDQAVSRYMVQHIPLGLRRRIMTSETLRMLILGFSDQQLVTGSAILLVAFMRFPGGNITIYHFTLVVDMAWFASNTHLITLTVLAEYLKTAAEARRWRVAAILCMGTLLFVATILASNESWIGAFNCPASCLTQQFSLTWQFNPATLYSLLTFLVGYTVHIIPLFQTTRNCWRSMKSHILDFHKQARPRMKVLLALHRSLETLVGSASEIFSSTVMAMSFHTIWFVFRAFQLFSDRQAGQTLINGDGLENVWSFGQVLAILLLVLNITAAVEVFRSSFCLWI